MSAAVLLSVLSWDSPRYLANLLDNLDGVAPTHQGRTRYHVHVLDQGSGPETVAVIKAFLARGGDRSASFLDGNVGFAQGHNRVFDAFHGRWPFDFFLVLNHDVLFGRATWLDRMVEGMGEDVAIGGPTTWRLTRGGRGMESCLRPDLEPGDPWCVQASVAMIRAAAVERFGLFDAAFTPAYFEDTDLSRRYAHAGLRLAWIDVPHVHSYLGPAAKLIRQKGPDLAARFGPYHQRNQALFLKRWLSAPPPAVTEADVAERWPGVYRPAR